MKTCPYCAEEISQDSLVCKYCGEEQIEPSEGDLNFPISASSTEVKNANLTPLSVQIINHLEFLGYECEGAPSDKFDVLVCIHETKPNLIIYCNHKDAYSFITVKYTLDHEKRLKINKDYYEIYNKINSDTMFTRWFSSKNDDDLMVVNVSGTYYGYEKVAFGKFIEYFDSEIRDNLKTFSSYAKD